MAFTLTNAAMLALAEAVVASVAFPQVFPKGALTSIFAIALLLNCSVVSLYKLVLYPFFLSPLRHLPQGRGFKPLVGHELTLFRRPGGEPHLKMMKEVKNDGLILTKGWFHSDKLIVASPAALADVLVHKAYDMEKPPAARDFLRTFLGDGLLMTEGDEYVASSYARNIGQNANVYV
jgi:hypothetical protein